MKKIYKLITMLLAIALMMGTFMLPASAVPSDHDSVLHRFGADIKPYIGFYVKGDDGILTPISADKVSTIEDQSKLFYLKVTGGHGHITEVGDGKQNSETQKQRRLPR